jgi:hypothetical protein
MKLRWLVFAIGLLLFSIGAYGLLSGSSWSNVISVLFTLLGLAISWAQVFFRFPTIDLLPTNSSIFASTSQVATLTQQPARSARSAKSPLPAGGVLWAIIIGCVAGIIEVIIERYMFAIEPHIQFLDFDIYLFGLLFFAPPLISECILAFLAGFTTGKVAVARSRGLIAGITVEIVAFNVLRTLSQSSYFNVPLLIAIVIETTLVALFGFLGAWLVTRKHPYYHK